MENQTTPELAAAARHLEQAKTSILEAIRSLGDPDRTFDLSRVAKGLGEKATHFRAGRRWGGLKESLIDARMGAKALASGEPSDEKLVGLVVARQALAEKRRIARERRESRKKNLSYSEKLHPLHDLSAAAVKRAARDTVVTPPPVIVAPEPMVIAPTSLAAPVAPKRLAIQEV
jgi:hypothetical protein